MSRPTPTRRRVGRALALVALPLTACNSLFSIEEGRLTPAGGAAGSGVPSEEGASGAASLGGTGGASGSGGSPSGGASGAPPEALHDAGGGRSDVGVNSPGDAGQDAARMDAGPDDAAAEAGLPVASPCDLRLPGEIAVYSFDADDPGFDVSGNELHAVSAGSALATVESVDGCGQALHFTPDNLGVDPATGSYLQLPDSAQFRVASGSLDFAMRFESAAIPLPEQPSIAVVSRDALNIESDGHFTLFLTSGARLVARFQQTGELDFGETFFRCSEELPTDTWLHVGVNFGAAGLEVWVDGSLQQVSGIDNGVEGTLGECGNTLGGDAERGPTRGMQDNPNVWLIGADQHRSEEGSTQPLRDGAFLSHATLDQVRFTSQAQDFSAFAPSAP